MTKRLKKSIVVGAFITTNIMWAAYVGISRHDYRLNVETLADTNKMQEEQIADRNKTNEQLVADNEAIKAEYKELEESYASLDSEIATMVNNLKDKEDKKAADEARLANAPVAGNNNADMSQYNVSYSGNVLTPSAGTVQGPSGKETYYNLDMSGVVNIMRDLGYNEADYPYWVREDGAKMLGNYIMTAASFDIRPRGTVVQTSLGTGLVCDTGGFAFSNPTQLDIATAW